MTPLSSRYQPYIVVLTFLTLIPVTIHSYVKVRGDDCPNPAQLVQEVQARESDPGRSEWMQSLYDAEQYWEGGVYPRTNRLSLEYAVIRSYNAKRLYYRPEHRYLRGAVPNVQTIEWIDYAGTRLPIHRSFYPSTASGQRKRIVAYLLMYEGKAIGNPYIAQLVSAPRQLVRGSHPMTLFLVSGEVHSSDFEAAEADAREWLKRAWQTYRAVCVS